MPSKFQPCKKRTFHRTLAWPHLFIAEIAVTLEQDFNRVCKSSLGNVFMPNDSCLVTKLGDTWGTSP